MRVRGIGPSGGLAVVGSAPGFHEDRSGKPFCGKTGAELDHFLNGLGLDRGDVFLTNLYRQFHGKDYFYTAADLAVDGPELDAELDRVQPTTIVTLGRDATRYLLGDVDLEAVWGLPWQTPRGVVVPQYHIAAAFHNADLACYVVAGFQSLAAYLRGEIPARTLGDDPYPEPQYEEVTTEAALAPYLRAITPASVLGCDSEGYPHAPWSVQYSLVPGRGFLIRAVYPALLHQLGEHLRHTRPRVIYHSALHEFVMLPLLGLPVDLPFDDTMVRAYLLQLEPLGLKPGVLRHCNMRQDSYDDIIGEVADRRAREYLTWLWDWEQDAYETACQAEFDWQVSCGRRIRKLPKLPRTALHKAVERCLASKTPRRLWGDQDAAIQAAAVSTLGFMVEPSLGHVAPAKAVRYGCRDADATLRYETALAPKVHALGLDDVYALELSTYPLIARMAQVGIKPDLAQFTALSEVLALELERLRTDLYATTDDPAFNANSGDHVAEYLFGRLGLMPLKMTPSGDRASTNDKILEALERANPGLPVISDIRAYRELYKLKYTFVDQLPSFVDRWPYDGRIHATFRTTRVVTGRLAASDPNVLAQPEHGKWAEEFKRGWVAEAGHVLCAWDESQVELRGLAHLSQDPTMLAIYRGELRNPDGSLIDLHAKLAQRVFGGPIEQYMHKCLGRLAAKAVNFGIPMGMTRHGLKIELRKNGLDVDEDDAQKWLDEAALAYPGVPIYKAAMVAEARRHGFIRCLSGRIRYIGGIDSPDERVREEAERFAFSTPIQESATLVMKRAEAYIWQHVLPDHWRRGEYVEPILQVHDCLKTEVAEGLQDTLNREMQYAMTTAVNPFSVPLAVEGEWGYNMADVEKFEEEERS